MARRTENFGRRELGPDEVIRLVKERFRTCSYLFNLGGVWIAVGAVWFALTTNKGYAILSFIVILIGLAIFSVGFVTTLAIHRCPVCDKYLSRFRSDKIHCPRCGTQVKDAS